MKPIHLTKEAVLANAREAWNNGTLQAKECKPQPDNKCRYRTGKMRCVIGASLSDDAARRFDSNGGEMLRDLIEDGKVSTDADDFLVRLQGLHDNIIQDYGDASLSRLEAVLFHGEQP